MKWALITMGLIIVAFFLGYSVSDNQETQMPQSYAADEKNTSSPSDWIKENQIQVQKDKVVINIENAKWAKFTDTDSMLPFLDENSNAIEVIPRNENDIKIGDIVSYRAFTNDIVIHRVIEKGTDEQGVYFILKGDNNPYPDPEKVRFSQIQRVLVAVIY